MRSKTRGRAGSRAKKKVPSFLGPYVSAEILAAVPYLRKEGAPVSRKAFRLILQCAAEYIRKGALSPTDFMALASKVGIEEKGAVGTIFTGVYLLLKSALEAQVGEDDLEQVKDGGLDLAPEFAADLFRLVFSEREILKADASESSVRYPDIDQFKWRVDVAISTSSLSKCLKPSVTAQLALTDGRLVSFDLPIAEFHELRRGVARVLKQMQDLEHHPVSRVMDHVAEAERTNDAKLAEKLAK